MSTPYLTPKNLYIFFALEIVLAGLIMLLDVFSGFVLIILGLLAIWLLHKYENNQETLFPIVVRTFDAWFKPKPEDTLTEGASIPIEKTHTPKMGGFLDSGGKTVIEQKQELYQWGSLQWAEEKTTFEIWEAACFIKNVNLIHYEDSSTARALTSEITHYVKQGLIDLAGEDGLLKISDIPRENITANSVLDRQIVEDIKDNGMSSWLPIVDKVNKKNRSDDV